MLELRDVTVSWKRSSVVRGIGLEVGPGEAVGLIGVNGSGKTSTLQAIFGVGGARAEGHVRFCGEEVGGLAPEAIAARGLALVPEGGQVFTGLTVAENLTLGAGGAAGGAAEMLARFEDLGDRAGERADRLSGGERQLLAIARALAGHPRLLALDEPSLGLSPRAIDSIYGLLEELRDEGMAILLAEQNAARTLAFCDRCLVLGGGAVRLQGESRSLRRRGEVVRAYLGGEP